MQIVGLIIYISRSIARYNNENTLFHLHRRVGMKLKHRHIRFRQQGITQKKVHNIQNRAKVENQELIKTANITFLWVVMTYCLVNRYQQFGEPAVRICSVGTLMTETVMFLQNITSTPRKSSSSVTS